MDRLPPVLRAVPRAACADVAPRRATSGCCSATTSTGSRSTSRRGSCRADPLEPRARRPRPPTPGRSGATRRGRRGSGRDEEDDDLARRARCSTASGGRSRARLEAGRHRVGRLRRAHLIRRGRHGGQGRAREGGRWSRAGGDVVWDLGANTGRYSRIAADAVAPRSWRGTSTRPRWSATTAKSGRTRADPAVLSVLDLEPPGPRLGRRRARSLVDLRDADVVLGLALVHHLAIGRNVPLDRI